MNKEQILDVFKEYLTNEVGARHNEEYDEFYIDIYIDYRHEGFSGKDIRDMMQASYPVDMFYEKLYDNSSDYSFIYGRSDLLREFKRHLIKEDNAEKCIAFSKYNDDITDFLMEKVFFNYKAEDFNKQVDVSIIVDVGDMNYEFTCNNVLNYYGTDLNKNSPMLWLAKQQGRSSKFKKACYCERRGIEYNKDSKFVKSSINELRNMMSCTSSLVFTLKMNLLDALELQNAYKTEEKINSSYYPKERRGTGYIVIGKDTTCGLYDGENGDGSLLGIELEKDVKLPIRYIYSVDIEGCYNSRLYGAGEIFDSCYWNGTIKEVHSMIAA